MRDRPGVVGATVARIDPATAVVALLTLGAFVLRLTQMDQSLFGDEVWTYQQVAHRSFTAMLHAIRPPGENAPPLFFILSWASGKLGDPTVWIRLPSLVLGIATIPVVYLLGRDTVGRAAGVIGAAVIAASPFTTYYGLEARPYAPMAFFVALSTVAIVKATRTDSVRWWALYAVSAAAAAYTGYTAVFLLVVQASWSLWVRRTRLMRPLLANATIVALYLPWVPHVHAKQLEVIGALEPFTLHNALQDVLRIIPGYPYASLSAIPTVPGLVIVLTSGVVGALALAISRRRAQPQGPSRLRQHNLPLICALAAAAPVGVALYSSVSTDIWDARDLYASVPAAALVLATLIEAIPFKLRLVALVAVFATLVVGTIRAISPTYSRPAFRVAAQYLDRVAAPRDPIILYPSFLSATTIDIPVHFHSPHVALNASNGRWPQHLSGARVYLVMDDVFDRALRIPLPHPRGFELVNRVHYSGLLSFTIVGYRRTS